ncbi:MAG: ATP-binding protein [Bacteroidetes bacterium]|nr:ATP-binding protein [Bacteroidota bacterium]MCL5025907.1 ATP-binding protein [Chloroflexota bacterium]
MDEDSVGRSAELPSDRLAALLLPRLSRPPASPARPALVMLAGLPGAGKTHLARRLVERLPFVVVETDWVRKTLYPHPTYSSGESFIVHEVAYRLIAALLAEGQRVIFDATNLKESNRRRVYGIAEKVGANLVLVHVVAAPDVVRERMEHRQKSPAPEELSDAGWEVYVRFAAEEDPFRRPHVEVDTARPLDGAVDEIVRLVEAEG